MDRARQLLQVQADIGEFYNGNLAKLILLGEREHGHDAADRLIKDVGLDYVLV